MACLSKVADDEDSVVSDNTNPTVLKVLNPNKYGTVPKSQDLITHGS